jgi:hypothetical protein
MGNETGADWYMAGNGMDNNKNHINDRLFKDLTEIVFLTNLFLAKLTKI